MQRRVFVLSATATAALTLAAPAGARTGPAAPASGNGRPSYPFGARRVPYVAGIRPRQSQRTMDALLTRQYDAWRAARVVRAGSVAPGGYAIGSSKHEFMTISEGMGYGMLLAALFAGHDPKAQSLFDGLLAVVRARHAHAIVPHDARGKYLMEWRIQPNGSSGGDGWNAMDGDLDIAMALLMADKQWGSGGTWNYLQEARNTIAALKSWNMAADGTTKGLAKPDVSRTSDYMIGHFRAFQVATGDSFWSKAVDRAYQLTDRMQTVYAPKTGLVPDFIAKTNTAEPIPSPDHYGDNSEHEDQYWWNACRNPWRYASDYLLSGDPRWKKVTMRLLDFFDGKVRDAGGDVTAIECGYELDGTVVQGGDSSAFIAPVMVAGCVDAKYQNLVDATWAWNARNMTTGYYDGEIQLLSMVVASGNWWTPR